MKALALVTLLLGSAEAVKTSVTFYQTGNATSACGKTLHGSFRQIAVSQDMKYAFPCGSKVRVTLVTPKGGVKTFTAIANDRMPRGTPAQTIDILVKHSARLYGRTSATVVRIN